MRRILLLLLVVTAGSAFGAFVGVELLRGTPDRHEPDPPIASPAHRAERPRPFGSETVPYEGPSYYLNELRRGGIAIDAMTPLLISPVRGETIPPGCPERLQLMGGTGTYADTVRPYLDAVGPLDLPTEGIQDGTRFVLTEIERRWRTLRALARGPVTNPPLRVLVKHYPRPDLGDGCYTIQTTFYNCLDPYFDRDTFQRRLARTTRTEPLPMRGLILDLRRTCRVDSGDVRVVEAAVTLQTGLLITGRPRRPTLSLLEGVAGPSFEPDGNETAHFEHFAGGERIGLVWLDVSLGEGEPDVRSVAFRKSVGQGEDETPAETHPLTPSLEEALVRFCRLF